MSLIDKLHFDSDISACKRLGQNPTTHVCFQSVENFEQILLDTKKLVVNNVIQCIACCTEPIIGLHRIPYLAPAGIWPFFQIWPWPDRSAGYEAVFRFLARHYTSLIVIYYNTTSVVETQRQSISHISQSCTDLSCATTYQCCV